MSSVQDVTREDVKEFYGNAGRTPQPGLCCPTIYTKDDISHIPQEVMEISYGCGSPVTLAEVKEGEVFLDLGSGGGVDCFIASRKVGKSGRVIGVDMTPDMMQRATANTAKVAKNLGYYNVEFRHGFLEDVPVDEKFVDIVTSNCVVNLSNDKKKVFSEIWRILKNGGRFVISDIVAEKPVPIEMQKDKILWGECISGALTEQEFQDFAKEQGFYGLQVLKREFYKEANGHNFWSVTLRGWKFEKSDVCNYIGQFATYLGPYATVTDDEGHTYERNIPFKICTDTAKKLNSAPYKGYFLLAGPDAEGGSASDCCAPASNGKSSCC
ncbi:MAG: methyltransferase domain-containing protein [Elusimicrobiota bacterium]